MLFLCFSYKQGLSLIRKCRYLPGLTCKESTLLTNATILTQIKNMTNIIISNAMRCMCSDLKSSCELRKIIILSLCCPKGQTTSCWNLSFGWNIGTYGSFYCFNTLGATWGLGGVRYRIFYMIFIEFSAFFMCNYHFNKFLISLKPVSVSVCHKLPKTMEV